MSKPKTGVPEKTPKEYQVEFAAERRKQVVEKKIEEAKNIDPTSPYMDDRSFGDSAEDKDLKDAWKQLIRVAEIRFPKAHAAKFNLQPRQRLMAIAQIQGWTIEQIVKASGFSRSTVFRCLKDPLVQEFQIAFEQFVGKRDGREMLEAEIYSSIQVLKDLRDDPRTPASVRQNVCQWFWEQKYGKAKETREVKGDSIRDLTKLLMDKAQDKYTEKEEKEEKDPEWIQ